MERWSLDASLVSGLDLGQKRMKILEVPCTVRALVKSESILGPAHPSPSLSLKHFEIVNLAGSMVRGLEAA